MRPITDFDEFQINGYSVTTDLSSAQYHAESDTITIQGHAIGDGIKRQIEIEVQQEQSADLDTTEENIVDTLNFQAGIIRMKDIESGKIVYHV